MDDNTKDVFLFGFPVLASLATAYFAYKQGQTTKKLGEVVEKVELVEKHTNSMKDQLVSATKDAAHAAGREEERAENTAAEAQRAIGRADADVANQEKKDNV